LREALAHPKAVAVGETGLDYFRDYAPRDAQRRIFDAQLELAAELQKPVIIHTRGADEDTLAGLDGFAGTVVLHCFSSLPLLEPALERSWYVSFAGNVTYKNAHDLRSAAYAVPVERLLAETDSPYLTPVPLRGRPNEPANVVHTVASLARARNADVAELAAQMMQTPRAARPGAQRPRRLRFPGRREHPARHRTPGGASPADIVQDHSGRGILIAADRVAFVHAVEIDRR
jgi:TatD DNase family protein